MGNYVEARAIHCKADEGVVYDGMVWQIAGRAQNGKLITLRNGNRTTVVQGRTIVGRKRS